MYNLNGQVAIVTGAGSGIGRAIAMRLSLEGAAVVAADLNEQAVEKLIREVKSLGRRGLALVTDVSSEKDVARMVEESRGNFGQIDILVNNAGTGSVGLIIDHSEEDWEKPMRVNLKGTFLCSRAVAKEMIPRKRGRIVNISSISGKSGEEFIGAYCASKFGVIGLTQVLAKELARHLITVNAVCPGFIDTEMTRGVPPNVWDIMVGKIWSGKVGSPEDVGNVVAYLVSDEASYLNGEVINISGGMVL